MSQQISRYRIISEIGSGGFSTVFAALDPSLDREVALKVMRPLLMSDPDFVFRFQREAQVAANLQHPNIVPIYDYGEFEGRLYLVMKRMHGSLAGLIDDGPLKWEIALKKFRQVAAGLDFAHSRDVIHRDIKPDNILLDKETETTTLADFGIVKALGRSTLTLSMTGGVLGTPAYVAPEIWNGEPASPASDLYALACVMFEMVTGEKLFEGPTPPATMTLHFRPPQYPEAWPEGVPPGLTAVLDRALSRDAKQRYPDAKAFAGALGALALDPLAEEYAALQEAVSAKAWDKAVLLAESILTKDAGYKDVSTLLRLASDAKLAEDQTALVREWRERAESALAADDWAAATAAARQWLQLAPDDEAAKAFMARAAAANELARARKAAASRPAPAEPAATAASRKKPTPVVKRAPEAAAASTSPAQTQTSARRPAPSWGDSQVQSQARARPSKPARRQPSVDGVRIDGGLMTFVYIMVAAVITVGLWTIRIREPILEAGPYVAEAVYPLVGWVLGPIAGPVASGIAVPAVETVQPHWPYYLSQLVYALGAAFSSFAAGIMVAGRRKWWRPVAIVLVLCYLFIAGFGLALVRLSIVDVVTRSWPYWSSVLLFLLPTRTWFANWIMDQNLGKVVAGLLLGTYMVAGVTDLVLAAVNPLASGWLMNEGQWGYVWFSLMPTIPKIALFRCAVGTAVGLAAIVGLRWLGLTKPAEAT